ncbi:MAG: hypothetical protein IIU73_04695 [Selenomonadales bacterium]|nr:hypothetical protein [Selenomonadales bacterium]
MTDAETNKQVTATYTGTQTTATDKLTAPRLPTTIDGDGRYVMSLLSDFCQDTATLVNRANNIDTTAPTDIADFRVTFDRHGVLWQWASVPTALCYELTAGTTLLARTTETTARIAPPSFSGSVALTAHLADGTTITATLSYTKPRPKKPTNVTLSRTEGGTVIAYDSVPTDCIGAQLTIDGYTARTSENSYFYRHDSRLTDIAVAYYDSFGAGDALIISATVPPVTGFFAEQNGDWLDLTWHAASLIGARYIVKVAYREPDWNGAVTLTETADTHVRLRYPQAGRAYFLIKAFDTYGNASTEATWTTIDRIADHRKNVIITLDQADTHYGGTKTNLYYDAIANGLKLADGNRRGEYLIAVHLPEVYRARSWLEAKLIGVTDDRLCWDDAPFSWESEDASTTVWNGTSGDLIGATLTKEIAEASLPAEGETVWTMDGTLSSSADIAPTEAQHADTFLSARWNQGLLLSPITRLAYETDATATFGMVFHLTTDTQPPDCEIVSLRGADGTLTLRYDNGAFTLIGTDDIAVRLPYTTATRDFLALGIEQTATARTLRLASLAQQTDRKQTTDAPPCMTMTTIAWYPR